MSHRVPLQALCKRSVTAEDRTSSSTVEDSRRLLVSFYRLRTLGRREFVLTGQEYLSRAQRIRGTSAGSHERAVCPFTKH